MYHWLIAVLVSLLAGGGRNYLSQNPVSAVCLCLAMVLCIWLILHIPVPQRPKKRLPPLQSYSFSSFFRFAPRSLPETAYTSVDSLMIPRIKSLKLITLPWKGAILRTEEKPPLFIVPHCVKHDDFYAILQAASDKVLDGSTPGKIIITLPTDAFQAYLYSRFAHWFTSDDSTHVTSYADSFSHGASRGKQLLAQLLRRFNNPDENLSSHDITDPDDAHPLPSSRDLETFDYHAINPATIGYWPEIPLYLFIKNVTKMINPASEEYFIEEDCTMTPDRYARICEPEQWARMCEQSELLVDAKPHLIHMLLGKLSFAATKVLDIVGLFHLNLTVLPPICDYYFGPRNSKQHTFLLHIAGKRPITPEDFSGVVPRPSILPADTGPLKFWAAISFNRGIAVVYGPVAIIKKLAEGIYVPFNKYHELKKLTRSRSAIDSAEISIVNSHQDYKDHCKMMAALHPNFPLVNSDDSINLAYYVVKPQPTLSASSDQNSSGPEKGVIHRSHLTPTFDYLSEGYANSLFKVVGGRSRSFGPTTIVSVHQAEFSSESSCFEDIIDFYIRDAVNPYLSDKPDKDVVPFLPPSLKIVGDPDLFPPHRYKQMFEDVNPNLVAALIHVLKHCKSLEGNLVYPESHWSDPSTQRTWGLLFGYGSNIRYERVPGIPGS